MKTSPPKKNEPFSTKLIKFVKKQCILGLISAVILVVGSVIFLDSKIKPISISLPIAAELVGNLAINERLRSIKSLHTGKIKGCESMARVHEYIYCGTQDSKLVKFNDTHIDSVFKLGHSGCKTVPECGRALGIRYDRNRNCLFFVDAFHGLFQLNLTEDSITKVFPLEGDVFQVTMFNDLEILDNGDIVVTESSTKYQLHNLMSAILEGRANGRLILITPSTGHHRIVADNLYFPNGVQVHSKDPNVVLVVETLKMRILAINIRDISLITDNTKIFADSLPGFPDNIRPSYARGGYWVNFARVRHSGDAFIIDLGMSSPFLRNCLKKFFSDPILHMILSSSHGIVVRYDEVGNVAESLHDSLGLNVTTSSETLEVGQSLYLGNYYLPYVVKVAL